MYFLSGAPMHFSSGVGKVRRILECVGALVPKASHFEQRTEQGADR
jgi:hypothetical protein